MQITAIKAQVKNPDRVSVFVDEKYSFSLDLDQLIQTKIKKGLELSESDLSNLKKISDDGKIRARALEWVMSRPHSTKELKDYFWRKKVDPETAQKIAEDFTRLKYLNDLSFAKWWASSRRQFKNKSNKAIISELRQKGIARQIIDEVVASTEENELEAIKKLITKKSKISKYQDSNKLAQYLTRQGFSYSKVKEALSLEIID